MSTGTAVEADEERLKGLAGGFSALMGGELVNKALRFAAAAVLARGLSPAEFGLFNVGIAVAGILVIATTLGLPEVAGRAVAVDAGRAAALARSVALARVATTFALGLPALAVLEFVWPGHLAFGSAILLMAAAMAATADWVGRALERMLIVGAGAGAGGATALVGAVVVTLASGSAVAGLAAFVVAEVVADVVYWTSLRGRARAAERLANLRPLLRVSWPVALSSLAIYSYYANLDTIIIAATRSEAEAGLYSGAYRIYLAANIVGIFAAYATFPRLSRDAAIKRMDILIARLRPTLVPLVGYGVLVVGLALVVGRELLELCFGARFGVASDTFVLLCLSTAWYCVGYPLGYNLIAAERNRRFLAGASVGAAVALVLDFALIPAHGMIGAGIATSVSIVVATVVWVGPVPLLLGPARSIVLALAASSAAAVAGLLVPSAAVIVGAVMIVAALVALAFTLGPLRLERAA